MDDIEQPFASGYTAALSFDATNFGTLHDAVNDANFKSPLAGTHSPLGYISWTQAAASHSTTASPSQNVDDAHIRRSAAKVEPIRNNGTPRNLAMSNCFDRHLEQDISYNFGAGGDADGDADAAMNEGSPAHPVSSLSATATLFLPLSSVSRLQPAQKQVLFPTESSILSSSSESAGQNHRDTPEKYSHSGSAGTLPTAANANSRSANGIENSTNASYILENSASDYFFPPQSSMTTIQQQEPFSILLPTKEAVSQQAATSLPTTIEARSPPPLRTPAPVSTSFSNSLKPIVRPATPAPPESLLSFYSRFQSQPPLVGPYDMVELRVTSIHEMPNSRECVRVIGVPAGETLHNIYRVILTTLQQKEDRARVVYHTWILPTGEICSTTQQQRTVFCGSQQFVSSGYNSPSSSTLLLSERDLSLNQLPIQTGFSLLLLYGKCVYRVTIEDILYGLTDEHELIWVPRLCEGSYGEAVPFDLCMLPALFFVPSLSAEGALNDGSTRPSKTTPRSGNLNIDPSAYEGGDCENYRENDQSFFGDNSVVGSGHRGDVTRMHRCGWSDRNRLESLQEKEFCNSDRFDDCDQSVLVQQLTQSLDGATRQRLEHLRPKSTDVRFLTAAEIDEVNKQLLKMRFIRQNSQIKPFLRKTRPEDYFPDEEMRCRWFRFPPRRFFFLLWQRQTSQLTTILAEGIQSMTAGAEKFNGGCCSDALSCCCLVGNSCPTATAAFAASYYSVPPSLPPFSTVGAVSPSISSSFNNFCSTAGSHTATGAAAGDNATGADKQESTSFSQASTKYNSQSPMCTPSVVPTVQTANRKRIWANAPTNLPCEHTGIWPLDNNPFATSESCIIGGATNNLARYNNAADRSEESMTQISSTDAAAFAELFQNAFSLS